MPPRKGKAEPGAAEGPPSPPAFYVATADLMLGHPEGGMPVPAYRQGDQVPRASVEAHPEWEPLVVRPEEYAAAVEALAGLDDGALAALAGEPPAEEAGPEADPADVPVADDDSAAAGKDGE